MGMPLERVTVTVMGYSVFGSMEAGKPVTVTLPVPVPPEWHPPVAEAQVVNEGGAPVRSLGGLLLKERNKYPARTAQKRA